MLLHQHARKFIHTRAILPHVCCFVAGTKTPSLHLTLAGEDRRECDGRSHFSRSSGLEVRREYQHSLDTCMLVPESRLVEPILPSPQCAEQST